jgi:hypothetical protein
MPTYSVSFRLQRTTVEDAFVSVPVTSEVMIEQSDGSAKLDVEKLKARALEMGLEPDVTWTLEESVRVVPHPIQKPPPEVE